MQQFGKSASVVPTVSASVEELRLQQNPPLGVEVGTQTTDPPKQLSFFNTVHSKVLTEY